MRGRARGFRRGGDGGSALDGRSGLGQVQGQRGGHAGAGRRPRPPPRPGARRAAPPRRRSATDQRGKMLPRERVEALIDEGSGVSRAVCAGGGGALRRGRARRRHHHRRRPHRGARVRRHRQRRDRQGRHLLPDHRQEAHPRPGGRRGEPPALRLPGGFRRRQPAAPGRGVSRPRALRPHLLQPGAHVGEGHRAGRRGDGLVHGGRRLRAGDVRRDRSSSESRARSSSVARRW